MKTNMKIFIIIILIFVTISSLIMYKNYNKNIVKKNKNNNNNQIISNDLNNFEKLSYITIQELYQNIKILNKVCVLKNDNIYIGDSEKEIENNFYDIALNIKANTLNYEIIKLWKNVNDIGLLNDKYLEEILKSTCKVCSNEDTLKKLSNILKTYYTKYIYKELEENKTYEEKMITSMYNLNIVLIQEKNSLKVKINME